MRGKGGHSFRAGLISPPFFRGGTTTGNFVEHGLGNPSLRGSDHIAFFSLDVILLARWTRLQGQDPLPPLFASCVTFPLHTDEFEVCVRLCPLPAFRPIVSLATLTTPVWLERTLL